MLIGMAVTFALVATLAAVAGGWAVEANQYGRLAAMAAARVVRRRAPVPEPCDAHDGAGGRLSVAGCLTPARSTPEQGSPVVSSFLLGAATGLLWAPCAGPLLGLILTGAALQGANVGTTLLLLAYALGAATSLALALAVGGKVFSCDEALLRGRGVDPAQPRRCRPGRGGSHCARLDTGVLTRLSLASTASLEQRLLDRLHPEAGGWHRFVDR